MASQQHHHTEVIILGDLNINPQDDEDHGFNILMIACNFVNVCEHRYETPLLTCNNNCSIDPILVTRGILPHIQSVGMIPKETQYKEIGY